MPTTTEMVASMLDGAAVALERSPNGALYVRYETATYRDGRGRHQALIAVQVSANGERVRFTAPFAFAASGPHTDAVLRACTLLQYGSAAGRLDYDERDGEIRATIELPLADATPTAAQLRGCLEEMVAALEFWYPTLTRAREDGVIGLPSFGVDRGDALRLLAHELRQSTDTADQLAAKVIATQLGGLPDR